MCNDVFSGLLFLILYIIGYKLAFNSMKAKNYADAIDVCQMVRKYIQYYYDFSLLLKLYIIWVMNVFFVLKFILSFRFWINTQIIQRFAKRY